MNLRTKISNPAQPVIFYELIPPQAGATGELETQLALIREVAESVDAINIPEIQAEPLRSDHRRRFPERIEPRAFARTIQTGAKVETVVNWITVQDTPAAQHRWMKETYEQYGVRNLILVGGESHGIHYPGPSVGEAASLASEEGLEFLLGGITIPSRSREIERIRRKYEQGIRFFTSQVLLDSNDIVDLIQGLNGLDVRIFLSFAPISHPRDLEFMQWLGVDVPQNVSWTIAQTADSTAAVEKSLALASKILTDIFDNLPPYPPALGINVEQITRRNVASSRNMLTHLSSFYRRLLQGVCSTSGKFPKTAPPPDSSRHRTRPP